MEKLVVKLVILVSFLLLRGAWRNGWTVLALLPAAAALWLATTTRSADLALGGVAVAGVVTIVMCFVAGPWSASGSVTQPQPQHNAPLLPAQPQWHNHCYACFAPYAPHAGFCTQCGGRRVA